MAKNPQKPAAVDLSKKIEGILAKLPAHTGSIRASPRVGQLVTLLSQLTGDSVATICDNIMMPALTAMLAERVQVLAPLLADPGQ